ncbi:MAG TPA: chromate transporter [Anaerolineaceae bacterium]|jgi:chromate transporter|nr:chromate transporter [Anaerolineaceae bacterium]HNZ14733.1 chromate transporter [Anaerolineaceae bacterium]
METESKTKSQRSKLWTLFINMLYISTFTFGGGFVIVNFMRKAFVERLGWIDEDEMLDLIALAQSSPGAIAVNASILVGQRVAGFAGMAVSVLGTILPPMIILTIISFFYEAFATNKYVNLMLKGMQAGVAALILDVVFDLTINLSKRQRPVHVFMLAAAFVATFLFNVNVVFIILTAALIGVFLNLWDRKLVLLI